MKNWLIIFMLSLFLIARGLWAQEDPGRLSNLDESINISLSGILAQKLHLELIASNIANMGTTRTPEGGPYKRKVALFATDKTKEGQIKGVRVADIVEDPTPCKRVYNPGHPDADAEGFVTLPNVDLSTEMIDLVFATRLYEANITVFNAAKQLATTTMDLSR